MPYDFYGLEWLLLIISVVSFLNLYFASTMQVVTKRDKDVQVFLVLFFMIILLLSFGYMVTLTFRHNGLNWIGQTVSAPFYASALYLIVMSILRRKLVE